MNENEIEFLDSNDDDEFKMTREEVEYLVFNIQNEFLSRDTYYLAMRLMKRMREYLDAKSS